MANWIELFKLFWEFLKEIFGMIVALFQAMETKVDVDSDVLTQRQDARATINSHEEQIEELKRQVAELIDKEQYL